jgi:hypothetical protein
MYVLMDHVGKVVHPLGEKPLDAAVAFCEYVRGCKPDDGRYPPACARAAFDAFRWHVTDGTALELFDLVHATSYQAKRGTSYSHIFEIMVVPRPACCECAYWKSDGAFCERGEREQASAEPGCAAWSVPDTEWKDVRPATVRNSTPLRIRASSEVGGENLRNLLFEFIEKKGGAATAREMKRRFKRGGPTAISAALDALIAEGWVVRVQQGGKRRGRPSLLYRLKGAEPPK